MRKVSEKEMTIVQGKRKARGDIVERAESLCDFCGKANAPFIVASPKLVRELVEEVKRLRELVSTTYPFVLIHCAEWSYKNGLPYGEYHPTHKAILDAVQEVFAEVNK